MEGGGGDVSRRERSEAAVCGETRGRTVDVAVAVTLAFCGYASSA